MKMAVCKSFLLVNVVFSFVLSGCGEEDISNSNTNNVKNSPFVEAEQTEEKEYIKMTEIKLAVKDILKDNYWPDYQLTQKELKEIVGITEDLYEDFIAEKMNVETDIDRMIIILAKDGKEAEVEAVLNSYREKLMKEYKTRPQEYGKAAASRIEIVDQYICFVQLGADAVSVSKIDAEKVLLVCQQENERAVDAIEKAILE